MTRTRKAKPGVVQMSVPVRVKIGQTEWETSLFPQGKTGSYLFAIKARVRDVEGI